MQCAVANTAARVAPVAPSKAHSARRVACAAVRPEAGGATRRDALLGAGAALGAALVGVKPASADLADAPLLCNAECVSGLQGKEVVELKSGLKYVDVVKGKGATPVVGYQVVAHYVAMLPDGRVFYNSREGMPKDFRVGAGQVVAGLDEGIKSMQVGGIRRLYVPGTMGFPKGLGAAPGRPRVPPNAEIMFDVQLLSVPGLDDEVDDEE